MSIRATGTVRENRTGHCPLIPVSTIAKEKRGGFDHCCLIVRWHDNSVVTMATNVDTVQPMESCKRWSRENNSRIDVQQRRVIANYNTNMGGVDLHDWNLIIPYNLLICKYMSFEFLVCRHLLL